MYFGFRFLYLIAIGCYLLAFVSELVFPRKQADELANSFAYDPYEKVPV